MKPDPLVGTSLAPALTGGRGVGGVSVKQAKGSAAWPSLLPFIPTQSPSRVNRGQEGMNGCGVAADGSRSVHRNIQIKVVGK